MIGVASRFPPGLAVWRDGAHSWLTAHARRREAAGEVQWGEGPDSVSVFHNLGEAEERALIAGACAWQKTKLEAGYAAIGLPPAVGGRGFPAEYERAFDEEENAFVTPETTELVKVTTHLVAPTIAAVGTSEQQAELVPPLLSADVLACQLFSEPAAGSDLAGVACRAVRDGDDWVVNGQKVWTSGARFAAYGELLARTDPTVPKHRGITAFLIPLDLPGVDIRPIRQMTGGASFNEVFFTDVRVPDRLRLGAEGDGWRVALITLAFERDSSGSAHRPGGSVAMLVAAARHFGRDSDPLVRAELAQLFIRQRVRDAIGARVDAARRAGQPPGPEASLGKILWTQDMTHMTDVIGRILGPALVADSGQWGTYAWAEHVLGAPGYRIAGGSDEIQRTIIAERVLGLPADIRVDKDVPFAEIRLSSR